MVANETFNFIEQALDVGACVVPLSMTFEATTQSCKRRRRACLSTAFGDSSDLSSLKVSGSSTNKLLARVI